MGKKMYTLGSLIFGVALLLGVTGQVRAQSAIEVTDVRVGYDFGEQIRFSAQVNADNPIREVLLIFRAGDDENKRVISLTEEAGRYSYIYDASQRLLAPFAKISFWFQVTLENGESFTSKSYSFSYQDDRFLWQMREDGNLRVHWHEGDEAFGQAALDTARQGVAGIRSFFTVAESEPLDIYIYASPTDLQSALSVGGETWVAGHASPALGVVLVSIAPGTQQQIYMQQQIPHELAHVLLYRYVGENYNRLPIWLLEGIASLAELYPNPDYQLALERAVENNSLIPISELCVPFSRDASQAFLSYAEAASFTRYLHTSYGTSGLDQLVRTYADGISCETGALNVFGTSLAYLDSSWQESVLGANLLGVAFREILPYLLILLALLASPLAEGIAILRKRKTDES